MNRLKLNPAQATTLLASSAVYLALMAPAMAQTSHVCSTESVDRSIEIILPAYGSAVCKVLYRKPDEGASDQAVFRSNDSMASCEEHAQELISELTAQGFDCGAGMLTAQRQSVDRNAPVQAKPAPSVYQTAPAAEAPRAHYSSATDAKWHLAGYADATLAITDPEDESAETEFESVQFNPVFHFQYKDILMLEAESEITVDEEGETEFELEYAQADLLLHDNAVLVFGRYLSPVGQFQERLHPSWINKLADAPAGFGHDGVQPATETGAMLRGGVSLGRSIATYAVSVGNGPSVSHEGSISFESKGGDDNDDKAISGRLGFLPVPYLEIGGSFLVGDVTGVAEREEGDEHGGEEAVEPDPLDEDHLDPTSAEVTLWGADAAYTRGPWDVRFEYLKATRDPIHTAFEGSVGVEELEKLKLEAWYAQIAYRLSGITSHRVLQNFEPAFRYGEFKVEGLHELAEHVAEERFDFGLNYWIAPSVVVRGVAQWRDFTARHEGEPSEENRYLFQFAYGF
ncbi:MAG: hypothetical protein ACE5FO_11060 [Parvularculaceae bacterium]